MKYEKYTLENRSVFISYASKIVHEWNGQLEIFTRTQVIEKFYAISALS